LENYDRSLWIAQHLERDFPDDAAFARSVGIISSYIGYVKMEMGENAEAVKFFGQSLSLMQKYADTKPGDRSALGGVGTAHLWLGVGLSHTDPDQGLFHINQALDIQQSIYNGDKGDFGELNALADCYLELGRALAKKAERQGQVRDRSGPVINEAIAALEKSVKGYETVWQTDHESISTFRQVAFARRYLADAFMKSGESDKALETFREALAQSDVLTAKDPAKTEWQYDAAVCHLRIGEILRERGEDSSAHLATAHAMLRKLSTASPESVFIKADLDTVDRLVGFSTR
jgi:tetratricopeptide (TPR) repeat protein